MFYWKRKESKQQYRNACTTGSRINLTFHISRIITCINSGRGITQIDSLPNDYIKTTPTSLTSLCKWTTMSWLIFAGLNFHEIYLKFDKQKCNPRGIFEVFCEAFINTKDTMRALFRRTPWEPWAGDAEADTPCLGVPQWCRPLASCSRDTETGTVGTNRKLYNVMSLNMLPIHIGVIFLNFPH